MVTTAITKKQDSMTAIETALRCCSSDRLRDMSLMERTITLAEGMAIMRQHFAGEILERVKGLQNTPLGFLTDRPDQTKAYHDDVVRDCVIEAMLRGAQPIGNEFNIISGRCYLTKAYFERQVRQFPNLTELRVTFGVPQTAQQAGGALVPCTATWKLSGRGEQIDCTDSDGLDKRIAVRVNSGMGVDAILGKATRKLYARIFARLTGSDWVDVDEEPTAELETEQPDASTPGEILFRGIEAILGTFEQIADVDAYQANAAALLTDDDDLAKLNEWCEARRQEIREGRGERSNEKE